MSRRRFSLRLALSGVFPACIPRVKGIQRVECRLWEGSLRDQLEQKSRANLFFTVRRGGNHHGILPRPLLVAGWFARGVFICVAGARIATTLDAEMTGGGTTADMRGSSKECPRLAKSHREAAQELVRTLGAANKRLSSCRRTISPPVTSGPSLLKNLSCPAATPSPGPSCTAVLPPLS